MKQRQTIITAALLTLAFALGIQTHVFAWGGWGDYNNNNNNGGGSGNSPPPTPTPVGGGTPTPTPPPAASTPDTTLPPDHRYITVELEVSTPYYSNRRFLSSGCTLNALIHLNTRRTTYRGYFEGSTRNPVVTASPAPGNQPVTDPNQLTQAPPPPTPTPPPTVGQHWWEQGDTARNWAHSGNRRRHHHDHQGNE